MSCDTLKGQDTTVAILVDGNLENELDGVTSCDITFDLTMIESRRLGQTSKVFCSVFDGISISIKSDVTGDAYIDVADAIVARAQRRAGAKIQFDVSTVLSFPDGTVRAITIPRVEFESIPLSIGGGDEFVTLELTGKASGYFLD